ncbi:hypothetical protein ACIPUC_31765 [Streptomyces sp. LARHCF249]
MSTADPRAILEAWLAGRYVRADGQPVAGRAWDLDTKYRYRAALAHWPVHPPVQAPYDQSWFTYIGLRIWEVTAHNVRNWTSDLKNQDGIAMSGAARAASAIRSYYAHCEDALGATSWRLPPRSRLVGIVPTTNQPTLTRDQMEALRSAADMYRGPMPERARLAVYLTLAGLRPGQSIGLSLLQIQQDNQHHPTWRLPAKNNSASAVAAPAPIPLPVVWVLDDYLAVRTWRAPHSTETTGPVLASRLGRVLAETAASLSADAIVHSPSPFA